MLKKIDAKGRLFDVREVPFYDEYRSRKLLIPHASFQVIVDRLEKDLDETEDGFSVGTRYPDGNMAWLTQGPFHVIYAAMDKDPVQAGYLLGSIVMDVIIHRSELWLCTKTNVTKREFETNFYFRPGI
jgi:hypothetical protein